MTRHIQGMLKVAQDLAFWAENNKWHPDAYVDDAIKQAAEKLGAVEAMAYASALAEHAAAELKMEQFQAIGWPTV